MRAQLAVVVAVPLIFAGSFLGKQLLVEDAQSKRAEPRSCRRIVSLAPSVTETLFALGAGPRVVGVTRYCNYPPEVEGTARIGGFLDPNLEAIVALRPDLVVALEESAQSQPALEKLALPTLFVRHKDVDGILASFPTIGRACGAEAEAERIVADIERRLARIREKTDGLERTRVLFVIHRTVGEGRLQDVCVAGSDGFFDRIVEVAGGRNACPAGYGRFPIVSGEGILRINPQVILDMTSGLTDEPSILADWQQVAEVEAVRNRQVYTLDHDYAFVPGPRFILLVEELARRIHPEVDWQ